MFFELLKENNNGLNWDLNIFFTYPYLKKIGAKKIKLDEFDFLNNN